MHPLNVLIWQPWSEPEKLPPETHLASDEQDPANPWCELLSWGGATPQNGSQHEYLSVTLHQVLKSAQWSHAWSKYKLGLDCCHICWNQICAANKEQNEFSLWAFSWWHRAVGIVSSKCLLVFLSMTWTKALCQCVNFYFHLSLPVHSPHVCMENRYFKVLQVFTTLSSFLWLIFHFCSKRTNHPFFFISQLGNPIYLN